MQTVNKLDYIYRQLVVKAKEQHNDTVEISDEEYEKYYEVESKPIEPTPSEEESNLTINTNVNKNNDELSRLEFPKVKDDGNNMIIIHRTSNDAINYSLEYDCNKKATRWVCYELDESNSGGYVQREDNFVEDPDIPIYAKFPDTVSMYMGSGYVRGHLIAPADRLNLLEANRQTFYYSNIQPMLYNFNGGIWMKLETLIRSWNNNNFRDTLYIVKGGTIDKEEQILTRIKPDVEGGLIVPKYFFAAILRKYGQNYNAIGFLIEHKSYCDDVDLRNYVVSIDRLEELTGIDFFCNLPDDIERNVESQVNLADWCFEQNNITAEEIKSFICNEKNNKWFGDFDIYDNNVMANGSLLQFNEDNTGFQINYYQNYENRYNFNYEINISEDHLSNSITITYDDPDLDIIIKDITNITDNNHFIGYKYIIKDKTTSYFNLKNYNEYWGEFGYNIYSVQFTFTNVDTIPELYTALTIPGEFCSITLNGNTYIFEGLVSKTEYQQTTVDEHVSINLGLSGLIVGTTLNNEIICYDLCCPEHYINMSVPHRLILQVGGVAYCSDNTYDLNNYGKPINNNGYYLYRYYNIKYNDNTLIISSNGNYYY